MSDTPDTAHAPARAIFLRDLRLHGNVSGAARAAGIGRKTAYRWRDADEGFKADWNDALEEAMDGIEAEMRRRGVVGVRKPIVSGGEIVTWVQEYSDTLLLALAKAHRPEKFRDRVVKNEHSGVVQFEHTLSDALAKAEALRRDQPR